MADTRPFWKPDVHAFFKAKRLATILLENNSHILGVALAGSLARKEEVHHDIDLVVLHDGQAYAVGTVKRPEPENVKDMKLLELPLVLPVSDTASEFERVRGAVPVDITLVSASVLWNCTYLRALRPYEVFTDFYRRTFNDDNCPLYLLAHRFRYSDLGKFASDRREIILAEGPAGSAVTGIRIWHLCGNASCKPQLAWKDCREEAAQRKATARTRNAEGETWLDWS